MNKKFTLIFVLILQLACGSFSTPEPSATPTSQPTLTFTPVSTSTTTPLPEFDFGDVSQLVVLDGFTINVPFQFLRQVDGSLILISNEKKTLTISFVGDGYDGSQPLPDVIDEYLASLEARGGQFEKSQPETIIVDGVEGVSVNVSGRLGDVPIQGMALAVSPSSDFVLFSLATSNLTTDESLWVNEHQTIFAEFIKTIKFVTATGSCTISIDDTYGYTQENPIEVGGDSFEGPSRERAYLDNLLGPNGETLSYEREGSIPTDTTIVDAYRVTGSGIDTVLYLDEYNYSDPQAPVEFTCAGPFPLSAP
jgi:hypothetical protein